MGPATVFEIRRFTVHDGPGIRTTVFLKGCPLSCRWCHNPEGIGTGSQLAFYGHKCIGCGECAGVCLSGAHRLIKEKHIFDREACAHCGACEDVCPGRALRLFGTRVSVEEAAAAILADRDFYRDGGGATLSGGEALLQADFCAALFMELNPEGIHCAIDTSGAVPWDRFETVLPYTDLFLYDVKHIDPAKHKEQTGRSNEQILANLERLSRTGIPIEIRVPVVPGFNDDLTTMECIAEFLSALDNIQKVKLLPFHALARSKYDALGMPDAIPCVAPPAAGKMEELSRLFPGAAVERTS